MMADGDGERIIIKWQCPNKHRAMGATVVGDDGSFHAPKCPKCDRRATDGWLASEGQPVGPILPPEPPEPPDQKDAKKLIRSELWQRFCALLDSGRVRMGGGGYSDKFCVRCLDEAHAGPRACRCECHLARDFRKQIEAAAAGKAA